MLDSKNSGSGGGLRMRKRTQGAHARLGSDEEAPPAEAEPPAPAARRPLAERPSHAGSVSEDDEGPGGLAAIDQGHDDGDEEEEEFEEGFGEEEYDEEEFDDERGPRRRVPSAIALALLVLFVSLSVVGFFARHTFTAPAGPEAARSGRPTEEDGAAPGGEEAPQVVQPTLDPSDAADDASGAAGGRIEETDLTVSQEDDGQGGLYVTIGDETWHGASSREEGVDGEVLRLEGPTAVNINMGFATKDPEAIVDHGSFGIYEPGGGLMYATVQRHRALGGEEALTRGTYTVTGTSGELYSGGYVDSLPDPESDRVVRTYTVEEGLPAEAGAEDEGPEPETLKVAYKLPRIEDERGKAVQERPLVPQLVGWHAPDGAKLHEIVDARKK